MKLDMYDLFTVKKRHDFIKHEIIKHIQIHYFIILLYKTQVTV